MKNNDDIVELSSFKYDLFETDYYTLANKYFNDQNRSKYINLFKDLLTSKDGKYYYHKSIINKILLILGEGNFIKRLPKDEQLEIVCFIKYMLKSNPKNSFDEEEFLLYKDKIINEYFIIENVVFKQDVKIDYNLLKLFNELLYDYPNILSNNQTLLRNIREYIDNRECIKKKYLSKIRCYLYSNYMTLRNNKLIRKLVIR